MTILQIRAKPDAECTGPMRKAGSATQSLPSLRAGSHIGRRRSANRGISATASSPRFSHGRAGLLAAEMVLGSRKFKLDGRWAGSGRRGCGRSLVGFTFVFAQEIMHERPLDQAPMDGRRLHRPACERARECLGKLRCSTPGR
jgi:hypothetical protein